MYVRGEGNRAEENDLCMCVEETTRRRAMCVGKNDLCMQKGTVRMRVSNYDYISVI